MKAPRATTLWARIALLGVAIALVTGVLAGTLAVGLIRSSDDRVARRELARLATAAQTQAVKVAARNGSTKRVPVRPRVLRAIQVRSGVLQASGRIDTDASIVRNALTAADRAKLRAGQAVSASREVNGRHVYIEARPVGDGAIILVQARSDATAGGDAAIRRTLLAILVGVAVSALLGVLIARRVTRPLRRTAQAAHALAQGRRDVAVAPQGPAEVAEVAEAVNTLSGALSHSETRQREFLLSVSHDLRTPLTAIVGYAESLAGEVVPPERAAEVGGIVLTEAQRLQRMVGDLLDLARLDARDFRVELGPVDLQALALAAAPVWDARCRTARVAFTLDAPHSVPSWTDAARVRQVLDGLFDNALRVTPSGRPIVLAVRSQPDGYACVEVRDGGPGLRPEDLPVAFDRGALYERYRGVRQVGTGLGLAIVHGLVTRLGGTVKAGHAPEGGARFTVRLPTSS